jgi:prepilin-type N-terminal cleavage/methylation domain-containing protein
MKKTLQKGFSLIELVISMGILGVVLLVISSFFSTSFSASTTLATQSRIQTEIRNVSAMISDEIQRATYVFPPCGKYVRSVTGVLTITPDVTCASANATSSSMTVSWSNFKLAISGTTVKNPTSGTYDWFIGAPKSLEKDFSGAAMLAMIVAPRDPSSACSTNKAGCYTFVAYYPTKRSDFANTGGQLDSDTGNDDKWVLMEYRKELDVNLLKIASTTTFVAESNSTDNSNLADRIPWGDAGCSVDTVDPTKSTCKMIDGKTGLDKSHYFTTPIATSDSKVQTSKTAIPFLRSKENDPATLDLFRDRIVATRDWLNAQKSVGSAKIILDYLRPDSSGFNVQFANNGSLDERGVNRVSFNIQMQIKRGNTTTLYPPNPMRFASMPRNLMP